MAATALVAARVEPEVKQKAKEVLDRRGITESQLIRSVFEYVIETGDVPVFTFSDAYEIDLETGERIPRRDKFQRLLDWVRTGPLSQYDWSSIPDDALEETLAEKEY